MLQEQQQRLIYEIVHHITVSQGLELIEIKISRSNKDVLIRILADRPQGGINLQECSVLNRSVVEAIDKEGILSEDGYSLEVSSPGLDRPLVTHKDFLRNMNREIRLWLKETLDGKTEHTGIVTTVTEENLKLLKTKEKKEIIVPVSQIIKGLLVI